MLLTNHKGLLAQPPYAWLAAAWHGAIAQVQSRRVPHAWLITGPAGIGCTEFALALSQYLLCIAPQEQSACGNCKSCLLLKAEAHPDLQIVLPEAPGKPIKIDQIRQLGDFVMQTSQQGGRKLVILYPAERMNLNAANALLKNLEEPSGGCVFVLVSDTPALLLATIRSRCQRLDVRRPPEAVALAWLMEQGVENAQLRLQEADGCPLRVMSWLDNDIYKQRQILRDALAAVLGFRQSPAEATRALLKFDAVWVMDEFIRVLTLAARSTAEAIPGAPEADELIQRLKLKPAVRLFALYGKLLQSKRLLLSGTNPNVELVYNDILIDFSAGAGKTS